MKKVTNAGSDEHNPETARRKKKEHTLTSVHGQHNEMDEMKKLSCEPQARVSTLTIPLHLLLHFSVLFPSQSVWFTSPFTLSPCTTFSHFQDPQFFSSDAPSQSLVFWVSLLLFLGLFLGSSPSPSRFHSVLSLSSLSLIPSLYLPILTIFLAPPVLRFFLPQRIFSLKTPSVLHFFFLYPFVLSSSSFFFFTSLPP